MLHKIFILFALIVLFACNDQDSHNHTGDNNKQMVITPTDATIVDTVKTSLPAIAKENINGNRLTIQYHSPAVRGRIIWGGLVAYNQVWVTGAHSATTFESPSDFIIGGKKIPKGKYAFFTIPGQQEWTIIINKNWDQHLADEYNQADDMVRITVQPETAGHQERLMYLIDQTGERKCSIEMRWDKIRVRVPVELVN